jgi:chromosome segregation ATPase
MDVETEIADIKRRLTALENDVKADRQLSVRIFDYVREMRDDIALLRSHAVMTNQRMERLEQRGEGLEQRMGRLERRIERLEQRMERVEIDLAALRSEFTTFRKELPGIVADAMREVLRDMRAR